MKTGTKNDVSAYTDAESAVVVVGDRACELSGVDAAGADVDAAAD